MDESNSMEGRPKTMENYNICKYFGFAQHRSVERSETIDEFIEEDIWGGAVDAEANQVGFSENRCNGVEECIVGKKGRRNIPKYREGNNNTRRNQSSSTPVKIPERCEMLWEEKMNIEKCWTKRHAMISDNDNSGNDGGGDFERSMIPPHELIAMQLARRGIASFSEYEGVGRTLKGRDAIWMMTGFLD